VVVVLALGIGGFVLFGGKKPVLVEVTSTPPGADVTLDGKALGQTPLQVSDPAPGAQVALAKTGFKPARAAFEPGQLRLAVVLEPLPPPPPQDPAPAATPEAAPEPKPEAKPEPAAEPKAEPVAAKPKPAAPKPAPKKAAPPPPKPAEKKTFDLFKHLEKQAGSN
jgi:hypothetical protein